MPRRQKKRLHNPARWRYKQTHTMRPIPTLKAVLALAALLWAPPSAVADDAAALFGAVAREHAKIRSIDAEITQYIRESGGPQELFRGRYRADERGRFRIDYTVPSRQVVRSDGKIFEWYYPDDRLLYYSEAASGDRKGPGFNPLDGIDGELETRFELSEGAWRLYGFFKRARVYHLKDRHSGVDIEVRVDPAMKAVISKTVRDRRGYEILRESYEGYRAIDGIWFPSRVSVTARTARGITSNVTDYGRVKLNGAIPDAVFRAEHPRGVTRRRLDE
jgi:outer membrane lipoprotein-sorting protein